MTQERLEELIEQGAIIYYASEYTAIELDFDNVIAEVCGNTLYCQNGFRFCIKDLFETEEQALWALKTVTERTERFEPPMWEEIKDKYTFAFFDCYDCVVRLSVFKNYNSINHIVVYSSFDTEYVYYDVSTKENYEKACEIVRDLFRGGE